MVNSILVKMSRANILFLLLCQMTRWVTLRLWSAGIIAVFKKTTNIFPQLFCKGLHKDNQQLLSNCKLPNLLFNVTNGQNIPSVHCFAQADWWLINTVLTVEGCISDCIADWRFVSLFFAEEQGEDSSWWSLFYFSYQFYFSVGHEHNQTTPATWRDNPLAPQFPSLNWRISSTSII